MTDRQYRQEQLRLNADFRKRVWDRASDSPLPSTMPGRARNVGRVIHRAALALLLLLLPLSAGADRIVYAGGKVFELPWLGFDRKQQCMYCCPYLYIEAENFYDLMEESGGEPLYIEAHEEFFYPNILYFTEKNIDRVVITHTFRSNETLDMPEILRREGK